MRGNRSDLCGRSGGNGALIAALAVWLGIAAPLRADPYHGINAGAPVWNGVIQFNQAKAAAIAATGCRTVRINFRMDGHAAWDASLLAQYDTVIQNAVNHNLRVLGLFSNECMPVGQNVYNDDPDGDGMNPYVLDFRATVRLLVDRYKNQIKRWEIWNEPNAWTNSNYQNDPKNAGGTYILPRVYANLLAESYKECELSGGEALLSDYTIDLVSGGLFAHEIGGGFSHAMDYMQQVYNRTSVWSAFQAAAGRRYPWRLFGYHFYLATDTTITTQRLNQYFNMVRSVQATNNDSSALLITEFGWNSASGVGESGQASNMQIAYNHMETRPYIVGAIWYQWIDEPYPYYWGITRGDGSEKPSYHEFVSQNADNLPPPEPQVTVLANPLSVNVGQSVHLSASVSYFTGASAASWRWQIGGQVQSGSGSPPALDPVMNQAGDFEVRLEVTDTNQLRGVSNTVTVHVEGVPHSPADFDLDGDVDMTDFSLLQMCSTGLGVPITDPVCLKCNLDGDSDVDGADFDRFIDCLQGSNVTADVACGVP